MPLTLENYPQTSQSVKHSLEVFSNPVARSNPLL